MYPWWLVVRGKSRGASSHVHCHIPINSLKLVPDANESNQLEAENTMVVRRTAAQVGRRWQVWKINSIPNTETNNKASNSHLGGYGVGLKYRSGLSMTSRSIREGREWGYGRWPWFCYCPRLTPTMLIKAAAWIDMRFHCCQRLIPTPWIDIIGLRKLRSDLFQKNLQKKKKKTPKLETSWSPQKNQGMVKSEMETYFSRQKFIQPIISDGPTRFLPLAAFS